MSWRKAILRGAEGTGRRLLKTGLPVFAPGCTNPEEAFRDPDISYVSGRDFIAPERASRRFGLYDIRSGEGIHIASSIWHWGKFYERIVREILDGAWKKKDEKTINYWWGISSGMIDVICWDPLEQYHRPCFLL